MRRTTLGFVLGGILASATPLYASHLHKYFPLKVGNKWSFPGIGSYPKWSMQITAKSGSSYRLVGAPWDSQGFWVAFVGENLYRWNKYQKKWKVYLPFGAAVGSKVELQYSYSFVGEDHLTLNAKNLTRTNPLLGKVFHNVFHFSLYVDSSFGEDTHNLDHYFAPGVGLIQLTRTYFDLISPHKETHHLESGTLGGKYFGPLAWTHLESGPASGHSGTFIRALFFSTLNSWSDFYKSHHQGAAVPTVNFGKKTVLAVLAGWGTYKVGSSVEVKKVSLGPNTSSLTVWVKKTEPSGTNAVSQTNPYDIVLLDVTGLPKPTTLIWNGIVVSSSSGSP